MRSNLIKHLLAYALVISIALYILKYYDSLYEGGLVIAITTIPSLIYTVLYYTTLSKFPRLKQLNGIHKESLCTTLKMSIVYIVGIVILIILNK